MDRQIRTGVTERVSPLVLEFIRRGWGLLNCLATKLIEELPVVKSTSKTTLKKTSHISFIEFNWIASTRGVFKSHINEVI